MGAVLDECLCHLLPGCGRPEWVVAALVKHHGTLASNAFSFFLCQGPFVNFYGVNKWNQLVSTASAGFQTDSSACDLLSSRICSFTFLGTLPIYPSVCLWQGGTLNSSSLGPCHPRSRAVAVNNPTLLLPGMIVVVLSLLSPLPPTYRHQRFVLLVFLNVYSTTFLPFQPCCRNPASCLE